jgi:chromosome segregation ATPase
MRRIRKMPLLMLLGLLLLSYSPAALAGARAGDGLTVAGYVEMTQSLLELSLAEWQERIDAATRKKGDRKELLRALEDVSKRYRARREEVYGRYQMSPAADLRYASDHRAEIEGYLEENAELRDALDSLKARLEALIQQFESAMSGPTEGAPR